MSTLPRQRRLGCPWAKIPVFATWVAASQWIVFGTKWNQCKMSLTRMVQQSAAFWHPYLLLWPWFPSFPLLQVGIFHDNRCESILAKPHLQKRHGVMIGQISKYAVHMTVSSGIRTVDVLGWGDQCGRPHNILMSWEERQVGSQHCKEPQNSSRRAVNQHRGSLGDLRGEMAWTFTEYWWARSRQGKQHIWREANNIQLSQMSFIFPQTWGYFLLGVMNLIASLLPHLFTARVATTW